MAPSRSKGKHDADAGPEDKTYLRFFPTPRSQELYNEYRRLQDEASTHVASSTRPTANKEGANRERSGRHKAKRVGPLDHAKRARAAFMRVIGACEECKGRRVSCKHFDRERFEQQYQAQRRNATTHGDWAQTPLTPSVSNAIDQEHSYMGTYYNASTQSYAGTPLGGPPTPSEPFLPAPTPNGVVYTGSWDVDHNIPHGEAWDADIARMEVSLGEAPPTITTPGMPLLLGIPDEAPPNTFGYPIDQTLLVPRQPRQPRQGGMGLADLSLGNFAAPKADGGQFVGIARKLEHDPRWECRHGDDATPGSGIEASVCQSIFPSLEDAVSHFETDHGVLEHNWSTWRCQSPIVAGGVMRCCDTLFPFEEDPRASGISCGACNGYMWRLWQYGLVSKPHPSAKGSTGRVVSRDNAFADGHWSFSKGFTAHAFQDQTSSNARWPGRDMGGGGYCGSQRSQAPRRVIAHGIRQRAKQWGILNRWRPAVIFVMQIPS
ncbi:hypothetical protein QBC39DRAFT_373037 [Podospora conica]|nr:hypothetical protein QBC39DRAFT_373037 [Schizothecium conicum]